MNPPLDGSGRQRQQQMASSLVLPDGNDAEIPVNIIGDGNNLDNQEETDMASVDVDDYQEVDLQIAPTACTKKEETESHCHLRIVAMTSGSSILASSPQQRQGQDVEAGINSNPIIAIGSNSINAIRNGSETENKQEKEGFASASMANDLSLSASDHLDAQTATRIARQDWQAKSDEQTASRIAREDWRQEKLAAAAPGAVAVNGNNSTHQQLHPALLLSSDIISREQEPQQQRAQQHHCGQDQENPTETNSYNSSNDNTPLHQQQQPNETLLEATLVEQSSNHDMSVPKPVEAQVVESVLCGFSKSQLLYLGGCLFCLLGAVAVAVAWAVANGNQDNSDPNLDISITVSMAPTPSPPPTLQQIRDRGFLRCGVWKQATDFFTLVRAFEKTEDQVDYVLCRAYAAAILGDPDKHEIILTTRQENLEQLHNKSVDMLTSQIEAGMESDESARGIGVGFTFSTPYIYSDFVYGGLPEYVACADDNTNARGNCSGLRICTSDQTAYFEIISKTLPESHTVKFDDTLGVILGFTGGQCNVVPSENNGIMEWGLNLLGYRGPFVRGTVPFAKDVATVATRDDDVGFSDLTNIILLGLFAAEEANITRENATNLQAAPVLGSELANAVSAVGSYKDVYQRGVAPVLKRGRWNLINNGTTGLLYSLPLGRLRKMGPGPIQGGTLERVWGRIDRKLLCGIRIGRPGFADWDHDGDSGSLVGMDVDFCAALAASILEGEAHSIEFVPVLDEEDGYAKLHKGEVDVLAGFTWNVVNDYKEPSTGAGFTFSLPYFYSPVDDQTWLNFSISFDDGDNRCLVSRQDDPQFSSFVYWVVTAIVYAEEKGITQAQANEMPDVNLFGENFLKMFRDAVYYFGNYREGFERNLGDMLPERGRNAINHVESPGPQFYVPPGFF